MSCFSSPTTGISKIAMNFPCGFVVGVLSKIPNNGVILTFSKGSPVFSSKILPTIVNSFSLGVFSLINCFLLSLSLINNSNSSSETPNAFKPDSVLRYDIAKSINPSFAFLSALPAFVFSFFSSSAMSYIVLVVLDKKESIFFNIFSIAILVDEAAIDVGPKVGSDVRESHKMLKD